MRSCQKITPRSRIFDAGIYPKKRLGQNFLIDKNILKKIIAELRLNPDDIVLEIGAGCGFLTRELAGYVKKVVAVEFDRALCNILRREIKGYKNIEVICQDILKLKIKNLKFKKKIKVIGNLPFYISTPIIAHLLSEKEKISKMFITVQKELAERMIAGCNRKSYGTFSLFIQYHCLARILFNIKRSSFWPKPKVDASFLVLEIRERPPVVVKDEVLFFRIIRLAFLQRRKTIKKSLSQLLPRDILLEVLLKAKIDPRCRAQELSLSDFSRLTFAFKNVKINKTTT